MNCLTNAIKPILSLYENKHMDNNFDSRQKKQEDKGGIIRDLNTWES